jgi:Sedlin, N-terminal conserved region
MSSILVGVAVIGKSNEPLYLCDCENPWYSSLSNPTETMHSRNDPETSISSLPDAEIESTDAQQSHESTNDPFGFANSVYTSQQRSSMPLSGQILVHAALDCLEERVERPSGIGGPMPVIKKSAIRSAAGTSTSTNPPPHWLGLLLDTPDGYAVYGYITATNIKFMAITKDVTPHSKIILKLVQGFLREVHQHYTAYVSNPFCNTTSGSIVSHLFDERIARSVAKLQQQPAVIVD